jgi:hypothetical protein
MLCRRYIASSTPSQALSTRATAAAAFTRGILGIAAAWAISGLTFLPQWTARHDAHGMMWLPVFAYALLRSPRKAFFASLFIATTDIELAGTWLGNWLWAPVTPWLHLASGNPPSAIAGGYAIIDGSMLQLAALMPVLRAVCSRARMRLLFLRRSLAHDRRAIPVFASAAPTRAA